ncbi:unnamed protein product [Parnassius mnemosyne]|uniref:C2H2-type domain-containing protein n=1 Tax=Parnassius mnemosyne TaxID=213953 RepID=A0AAV1LGZ7_9NEOP
MSDEEHEETSNSHLLSTEFKDGQLQIVEVNPYEKVHKLENVEEHVLAEGSENSGDGDLKYMQVLDSGKGMMVDLLNLTLVRCEDGQESYQLVTNVDSSSSNEVDATVACVLQASDDADDQESQETYVMVDGTQGPLVFLQQAPLKKPQPLKPAPSAAEILEKAKALQKAKNQVLTAVSSVSSVSLVSSASSTSTVSSVSSVSSVSLSGRGRGRRRRGELPPPHEMLASPNFKLFLYSCKFCDFRCNAIKELTAHKAAEHGGGGGGGGRGRGGWRATSITLQCARCPFRGCTHSQLMRHVQENHMVENQESTNKVFLNSAEVEAADVLVCGACGFESSSRIDFKKHIEDEHGATAC